MIKGNDYPLSPLCDLWLQKIQSALETKWKDFGETGREIHRLHSGYHDWIYDADQAMRQRGSFMWSEGVRNFPTPSFKMTVNKFAELQQIFGGILYPRNPTRKVIPRLPIELPMDMFGGGMEHIGAQLAQSMYKDSSEANLRALILERYLNYTVHELDFKRNISRCIDEALILGRGIMWSEVFRPPGGSIKLVGSFFDTVDHLVIDPDSRSLESARWIARMVVQPTWMAEAKFGLPEGTIRGLYHYHQASRKVVTYPRQHFIYSPRPCDTNDHVTYWEIYSKMGVGDRMDGADPRMRGKFDFLGSYIYLAVCHDLPYPLNLPPKLTSAPMWPNVIEMLRQRVSWPSPFWMDNGWPFVELDFHVQAHTPWPYAHMKPAMGELLFLDWAFSFLASKVKNSSRDFIAILKSAGDKVREVINRGADFDVIDLESSVHASVNDVVQFLQIPPMNKDLIMVVEMVNDMFEKRTGLSELIYGQTGAVYRSAEEARLKGDMLNIRPDDMMDKVEDFHSVLARREAMAARSHLDPSADIMPLFGASYAAGWKYLISTSSFERIVREYEYRIEAGSSRKPNRDKEIANMRDFSSIFLPHIASWSNATGDPSGINDLIRLYGRAMDMDVAKFVLPRMPPPPVDPMMGGMAPMDPSGEAMPPGDMASPQPQDPLGQVQGTIADATGGTQS